MPPSQLKRLKSSLREQGITGPQKSKKQKKNAKSAKGTNDRIQKHAALEQIRDSFNPFEFRAPSSRPPKFSNANDRPVANGNRTGGKYKDVLHRPGVSKSAGEEMRKATLLPELRRRNKVGGLVDRRIGEGDEGLTAEERAVQRFAQEKQRGRAGDVFNLEGSDDEEGGLGMGLTHGGRRLDDLGDDEIAGGSEDEGSEGSGGLLRRKRRRSDIEKPESEGEEEASDGADDEPERKKSRKEVMEEVIAKSKYHKYERQKAKENDDDLRDELDKGFGDILTLLRGRKPAPAPPQPAEPTTNGGDATAVNPDRLKLLEGADREAVEKDYDSRIKQLAREQRAKPSERTKTEEEKIKEEAERLKDLEERRAKRMRGEQVSDDEQQEPRAVNGDDMDERPDEAAEFGFTQADAPQNTKPEKIVLEDEDEFALDDELVASGSELDVSDASMSEAESDIEDEEQPAVNEEEDEFVKGILGGGEKNDAAASQQLVAPGGGQGLAFTYPCPRSHQELLAVVKDSPADQLPTIIQRIRALHHPSLSATNKESMADFSATLVEHLSYMGEHHQPLPVAEQVIRHLHSLSRTYSEIIATSFRAQLQSAHTGKTLHAGDMVVLTAIGSIYPTSDHFHQVVTPAMTIMAKWLAMNVPDSPQKHSTGLFLVALSLHYQRLSKRYIPEAIRFTLCALSPKAKASTEHTSAHLANLRTMLDLWKAKPAFIEIFTPFNTALTSTPLSTHPKSKPILQHLRILLAQSRTARRPLELHHHKPLAIRTSIPKFEDSFDPDKHYDPDKDRSDARKLQKEYKRERKGAIRELRKDASFLAREGLREKKEKDREYERKQRRLIAEIQGEEGKESKEYEREKGRRKRRVGKK
ncbi:nucleolar complex protein 14 [Saxophila tyrrhenica]|uniref:Nucleolar complex protein 14 n=1 Tax=Saxophila tyrrhenica TaxID=1690608 RepID=A0AAV9PFH1_9PEZI|nr:nucleolar complex protein 14 [Saxophila tyrrhenica]